MPRKMNMRVILPVLLALLLVLVGWILWSNRALELNTYTVESVDLPNSFDGFRIAHVSDLHNAEFGDKNGKLLALLQEAQPDIIAITGDLIDSRRTNISVALKFAEEAVKIAPCYYVPGNHEARIAEYDVLRSGLEKLGVVVLQNENTTMEISGETITVAGVLDPSFETNYLLGDSETVMKDYLQSTVTEDAYTLLLSHRPELLQAYADYGIELVLSGHAHGGQFRLPLAGGLIAPNQGFFPEYDAGLFTQGNTNMIVSRGIGNSAFPFRFNNRPEVILVILKAV